MHLREKNRLIKLLQMGYVIEATAVKYKYSNSPQVIYLIADPTVIAYEATQNRFDDNLSEYIYDIEIFYEKVVELEADKDYTADTNDTEQVLKYWSEWGIAGATYLPVLIDEVWNELKRTGDIDV